jgi:hypothetical protein
VAAYILAVLVMSMRQLEAVPTSQAIATAIGVGSMSTVIATLLALRYGGGASQLSA